MKLFEKEAPASGKVRWNKHKQIRFYIVNAACGYRFASDYCMWTINLLVILLKNVHCHLLYMSCFVSRGNSIGKKFIRLDWEKAVYQTLFTLANTLNVHMYTNKFVVYIKFLEAIQSFVCQFNIPLFFCLL